MNPFGDRLAGWMDFDSQKMKNHINQKILQKTQNFLLAKNNLNKTHFYLFHLKVLTKKYGW